MSGTNDDKSSQTLADCQAKILQIDNKLSQIKSRYSREKTKLNYSLHTNEDFIILKKQTESLENDIQFVKTLLEDSSETESSFPLRFMKKIFPNKMFSSSNKPVPNEIKIKIIAHSTELLEEKVKVIQTLANSKKKRKKPTQEYRDSTTSETSNSIKLYKTTNKVRVPDSKVSKNVPRVPSLRIMKSLPKKLISSGTIARNSISESRELQLWTSEFHKYFQPTNNYYRSSFRKNNKNIGFNLHSYNERHAQKMEVFSCVNVGTNEKYAQTDIPVSWVSAVSNEIKYSENYIEKETNTEITENDFRKFELNTRLKGIHRNTEYQESTLQNNIIDISEMDTIINNLLCSPLKMLQFKTFNKLSPGYSNNPAGYVNLILRQSDFVMPHIISVQHPKKIAFCKHYKQAFVRLFPCTYHIKQITQNIMLYFEESYNDMNKNEINTTDFSLQHYSSLNYSNKSGNTEYIIQYKNIEINKKTNASYTIQIDYKNPHKSGRIVLTEFGNSQSNSQSEIITRILTHLIGISNSEEKK